MWATAEQCSALCDANVDCEMYAIYIRGESPETILHCIWFSYADVASGLTINEGGNPHLKCAKIAKGNMVMIDLSACICTRRGISVIF